MKTRTEAMQDLTEKNLIDVLREINKPCFFVKRPNHLRL